ncbi:MAG TPA: hypothetical protein VGC51_01930 [Hansschlegelia sp.]
MISAPMAADGRELGHWALQASEVSDVRPHQPDDGERADHQRERRRRQDVREPGPRHADPQFAGGRLANRQYLQPAREE